MSKKEELEAKIKEQRVLEANKKGLTGSLGKIGTVLKSLGSDIVSQSMDYSPLDEESEPGNARDFMSQIPIMDIDGNQRPETDEWSEPGDSYFSSTRKIGMHFDGLSRGMHMEIKYDEEKSELSLTHRGYVVYKEVMGDIESYIPGEEWEGWIDKLWILAKDIQRKRREDEFKSKAEEAARIKEQWWSSLVKRWGKI